MGEDRYYHSATRLDDGTVLIAGGIGISGADTTPVLATAELFDPMTGSWRATSPMNAASAGQTATLLDDGTVLLAGGLNPITGAAEVYDPRNRQWAATARMPQGRSFHTATLLESGEVLVLGGQKEGPGLNTVTFLYDPDGGP